MLRTSRFNLAVATLALGLGLSPTLHAQNVVPAPVLGFRSQASCDFSDVPGAVWWGTETQMTFDRLASYLAPLYWFSPDEPLLGRAEGADVRLPEALPFEDTPDAPVVYYQFEEVVTVAPAAFGIDEDDAGPGIIPDSTDKGNSIIDLERVGVFSISFFAYFTSEEGVGAHEHDVEATEYKVAVYRSQGEYMEDLVGEPTDTRCDEPNLVIGVTRVSAKAHGIIWFWNVLDVDTETRFPMFLLVEEGKHGLATDKNSDGYFTPGYDVNHHVNDAWGVRDIIRGGALFTGGYQAWMSKVRHPEHRAFPPLPQDSPLRLDMERRGEYEDPYAEYELRPFPPAALAADDQHLYGFMKDKEVADWPEMDEKSSLGEFVSWVDAGKAIKTLSIALRADGDLGFSFVFPFFIVKNWEDGLSGGFVVWRMYLKDQGLQDFGWMAMYTPSASRWFDTYFAAGYEWDRTVVDDMTGETVTDADFVLETGIKFRVQLGHSPLKFLTLFTDFWGLRVGIKNKGFFDIDKLTYVLEFGAGAF